MQMSLFPEMEIIEEAKEVETLQESIKPENEVCKPQNYKSFAVVHCAKCTQKLIVPKNTKDSYILCADCDEKRRTQFDKFRNFALIKALRIHKYLNI